MTKKGAIESVRAEDLYTRVRARIAAWLTSREGRTYRYASQLLMFPDFLYLVARLLMDSRVPTQLRTQAAAVIGYAIMPFDLLPEGVIGPLGFADDLLLVVLIAHRLLSLVPREVVLEHWRGSQDLLRTIDDILGMAEEMVGGRLWRRLKRLFDFNGREEPSREGEWS